MNKQPKKKPLASPEGARPLGAAAEERKSRLAFEKLCRLGCQEAKLRELLDATACLSLRFPGKRRDKVRGIADADLKNVPLELGKLAQRIEDVNKIFLPLLEAVSPASAQHRALVAFTANPSRPIGTYEDLPNIMRDFAKDFQYMFARDLRPLIGGSGTNRNSRAGKTGEPRPVGLYWETLRSRDKEDDVKLLQLLTYVEIRTGTPNYPAVARLLQSAFNAVTERSDLESRPAMPSRFRSDDALKKFYKHTPAHLKAFIASKL